METGQKISQKSNNIDTTSNHILSIQVSLNGLSFCVLDHSKKTISFYKSIAFERKLTPDEVIDKLVHQFNTEAALKHHFSTIKVIHDNELSTLVPSLLFDEAYLADYLKFNSKILRSDFITYDEILANNSHNVYIPYVNINNYLYDKFGEFEYKHASTILIENILSLEKNTTTTKMYVHINPHHFEIIITKQGQLELYNSFEYSTKEDFIYYILFTAEQLQLNPETVILELIGDLDTDHELYQIAYKYVRHVSLFKDQPSYTINDGVNTDCLKNFILTHSF